MEPNQFTTVSERWHVRRFAFAIASFVESSNAPNEMNKRIALVTSPIKSTHIKREENVFTIPAGA
jgi:hypothetical protein